MDDISAILGKVSLGSVPTWLQLGVLLTILWKGVPAFLDAISNRQSKIEERMQLLLTSATDRFERELRGADQRHADCEARCDGLGKRITELERQDAEKSRTIAEQTEKMLKQTNDMDGLKKQIIQMQESAMRVATLTQTSSSAILEPMLESLARVRRADNA